MAKILQSFRKDPSAVKDYTIDWSTWLETGDTLTSSSWTADDAGITIDSDDETTTTGTVWLSGGTAGTSYVLTNEIATAAGRSEKMSICIICKEG